jgi:hypothetical protein
MQETFEVTAEREYLVEGNVNSLSGNESTLAGAQYPTSSLISLYFSMGTEEMVL